MDVEKLKGLCNDIWVLRDYISKAKPVMFITNSGQSRLITDLMELQGAYKSELGNYFHLLVSRLISELDEDCDVKSLTFKLGYLRSQSTGKEYIALKVLYPDKAGFALFSGDSIKVVHRSLDVLPSYKVDVGDGDCYYFYELDTNQINPVCKN